MDDTNLTELVKHNESISQVSVVMLDGGAKVLSVPVGRKIESAKKYMDEFLLNPERKKGTATALTLDSFIELTKRGRDTASVLFAHHDISKQSQSASLTAVLNYNEATSAKPDGARFGDHRVHYNFPLSAEWRAWMAKNKEVMNQKEFAEFLEDHLLEIVDGNDLTAEGVKDNPAKAELLRIATDLSMRYATPPQMVELASGLDIKSESVVSSHTRLQSGETKIVYDEKHTKASGGALDVPGLFLIAIPVFDRGTVYRLPVRLRYRPAQGSILWFFEVYRWQQAFDAAFDAACLTAKDDTGLMLIHGSPEK